MQPMYLANDQTLFLLASMATALLAEDFSGLVVGVSDGDTIRVLHDGQEQRILLWGIDAPESKQPWETRAKGFTGDLAFGKVVTVYVRDIDRYGRTVAEIILTGGRNLGQELLDWLGTMCNLRSATRCCPRWSRKRARRSAACGLMRRPFRCGSGGRRRGYLARAASNA
jgi:hypothetical protein